MNLKIEDVCIICGVPFVEEHHIIPKCWDGIDDKQNKVRFCPNHHTEMHFLIKINRILKRKKQLSEEEQNVYVRNLNYLLKNEKALIDYYISVVCPAFEYRDNFVAKLFRGN